MSETSVQEKGRVIGIGGVFFKSAEPSRMNGWYAQHLGIPAGEHGHSFLWRDHQDAQMERTTVWALFPRESDYFGPSQAPFMINYIVDDMDALLEKLAASGAAVNPKREDHPYGRFAWIVDPEGNKVELWEPRG